MKTTSPQSRPVGSISVKRGVGAVTRGRTRDVLMGRLRDRIQTGRYEPGSLLPSERELAREFGVARMTLRGAVDLLENDGLVVRRQGVGTMVVDRDPRDAAARIGVVCVTSEHANSSEPIIVHEGAKDRLIQLGCDVHSLTYAAPGREREQISTPTICRRDLEAVADRYDGLIVVEALGDDLREGVLHLEKRRYPIVVANLESDIPVSSTFVNHARYIGEAVDTLVSLGHERIGYVAQNSSKLFYPDALRAYRDAIEHHGLPADPSLVVLTDVNSSVAAYCAVRPMLLGSNPPTAIVAARDLYAEGACHAIMECGAEIGRDISVIGFDDVTWRSPERYLTTYREPCYEMGGAAADILMQRVREGWQPIEKREIDAQLILRRSVGPVPKTIHAALAS